MGWSECPTKCGESRQTRITSCLLGSGDSAECDVIEVRPAGDRACSSYQDCPYDWLCPHGKNSDGSCPYQVSVMTLIGIGSLLLVVGCCCIGYIGCVQMRAKHMSKTAAPLSTHVVGEPSGHYEESSSGWDPTSPRSAQSGAALRAHTASVTPLSPTSPAGGTVEVDDDDEDPDIVRARSVIQGTNNELNRLLDEAQRSSGPRKQDLMRRVLELQTSPGYKYARDFLEDPHASRTDSSFSSFCCGSSTNARGSNKRAVSPHVQVHNGLHEDDVKVDLGICGGAIRL